MTYGETESRRAPNKNQRRESKILDGFRRGFLFIFENELSVQKKIQGRAHDPSPDIGETNAAYTLKNYRKSHQKRINPIINGIAK